VLCKMVANHQFAIIKAEPDDGGLIDSYHPFYTFKYGNQTMLNIQRNGIREKQDAVIFI